MANCCDYSPCEGLATIGFMRSLIPNEMDFCVQVSAGTIVPTCCGNVSESDYVPKYSEIINRTFCRHLRVTASTPSEDVNGFTFVTPTLVTTDCCTGDTLENEALMKSQLGFEYTSSVTCSHINVKEPNHCDLSYGLTVLKEWDRHRYECDANSSGNIKHSYTQVVDDSEKISSALTRNIKEDISGGRYKYTFSFDSVAISSETAAPCSAIKTASTIFSAATYTRGFSLNCPGRVPCTGGTYEIATIDQMECDGEISLEITCNIEGTPEILTLVGSSRSSGATGITIGYNNDGRTSGSISVKATVWGKVYTYPNVCQFDREVCGWSPTDVETTDCSIFTHKLEWTGRPNIIEHSCQ